MQGDPLPMLQAKAMVDPVMLHRVTVHSGSLHPGMLQPWNDWSLSSLSFSNLELGLMVVVLLLCLVCGGLWLRQLTLQRLLAAETSVVVEAVEEQRALAAEAIPGPADLKAMGEQLETLERERDDLREEAELILLQLHQVQEELEHYFLLSRSQQELLERFQSQLKRSRSLLLHLHHSLEGSRRQQRRSRKALGRSVQLLRQAAEHSPVQTAEPQTP